MAEETPSSTSRARGSTVSTSAPILFADLLEAADLLSAASFAASARSSPRPERSSWSSGAIFGAESPPTRSAVE